MGTHTELMHTSTKSVTQAQTSTAGPEAGELETLPTTPLHRLIIKFFPHECLMSEQLPFMSPILHNLI